MEFNSGNMKGENKKRGSPFEKASFSVMIFSYTIGADYFTVRSISALRFFSLFVMLVFGTAGCVSPKPLEPT